MFGGIYMSTEEHASRDRWTWEDSVSNNISANNIRIILYFQVRKRNGPSSCPNGVFLRKHACRACKNAYDALEFTYSANDFFGFVPTRDVLIGKVLFRQVGMHTCESSIGMLLKCQQVRKGVRNGKCKIIGKAKTFHHRNSGHLFVSKTQYLN